MPWLEQIPAHCLGKHFTMVNLRDMMVMIDWLAAVIRIRSMEMIMPTVCVSPG